MEITVECCWKTHFFTLLIKVKRQLFIGDDVGKFPVSRCLKMMYTKIYLRNQLISLNNF